MGTITLYKKVSSIAEVISALNRLENARVIAGGTDLLLKLSVDRSPSITLLDITGIKALEGIAFTDEGFRIGATTKMCDIAQSNFMTGSLKMLAQGAVAVGSPQIRNMATIGGNICNASPSADLAAPLLALDAKAEIYSSKRTRIITLVEFFKGPGQTILARDEILSAILIPFQPIGARGVYFKLTAREEMGLAIVGVAAYCNPQNGGHDFRLSLSAVAPTPIRAHYSEELLNCASIVDERLIQKAAHLAARESKPITDVRASKKYRRELVAQLAVRALREVTLR
jgi:carbon-monoxide dehydrogenase medium subunit